MRRFAVLAAFLLLGCSTRVQTDGGSLGVCLSKDTAWGLAGWLREAETELGVPVTVLQVHGRTDAWGQWVTDPDEGPPMPVEAAARLARAMAPTRPLILIVCNRDAHEISVAGVWYSKRLVWCAPNDLGYLRGIPIDGRLHQFTRSRPATQPTAR